MVPNLPLHAKTEASFLEIVDIRANWRFIIVTCILRLFFDTLAFVWSSNSLLMLIIVKRLVTIFGRGADLVIKRKLMILYEMKKVYGIIGPKLEDFFFKELGLNKSSPIWKKSPYNFLCNKQMHNKYIKNHSSKMEWVTKNNLTFVLLSLIPTIN